MDVKDPVEEPKPRSEAPGTARRASSRSGPVATGGDSGIGRAVAVLFAREPAYVHFVGEADSGSVRREVLTRLDGETVGG
jgi:hypothetical protein